MRDDVSMGYVGGKYGEKCMGLRNVQQVVLINVTMDWIWGIFGGKDGKMFLDLCKFVNVDIIF